MLILQEDAAKIEAPTFLMCSPEHYRVEYVINPWMQAGLGRNGHERAEQQWATLKETLFRETASRVTIIPPLTGLPDMVFTANAGLVARGAFISSRFRHKERSGEEFPFTQWAGQQGYVIRSLPPGITFEGAGDALRNRGRSILWMGHGFRTTLSAASVLQAILDPTGYEVIPLQLVDPRYYHLDTCFCPLDGGRLMWFPGAFSQESQTAVRERLLETELIEVSEADAALFACNAICVNDTIILNAASPSLTKQLNSLGYRVIETPLDEFIFGGGSAKCLTLRLDEFTPLAFTEPC